MQSPDYLLNWFKKSIYLCLSDLKKALQVMNLFLTLLSASHNLKKPRDQAQSKFYTVGRHNHGMQRPLRKEKMMCSDRLVAGTKPYNPRKFMNVYDQLKSNCHEICEDYSGIFKRYKVGDETANLRLIITESIKLTSGIAKNVIVSNNDILVELALVICLAKSKHFDYLFRSIEGVFGLTSYPQSRLYEAILDQVDGIKRKFTSPVRFLLRDDDRFILFVLRHEIVNLIQMCYSNFQYLGYFINYPALIERSFSRITYGTNYTGYDGKFLFYDFLFRYVNDLPTLGVANETTDERNSFYVDLFITHLYDIYKMSGKKAIGDKESKCILQYSFPNMNEQPIYRDELRHLIRRYKKDTDLYHLLLLPFTYCGEDRKKATITKIVEKETGCKLEVITMNQTLRGLGFFVVLKDIQDQQIHDPWTLDALGLQYNADVLECRISQSMMLLPFEYVDCSLLIDYVFITITWLSFVLRNDYEHVSFRFYLPNINRSYDIRRFALSKEYSKKVDLFFTRCGVFKHLNPNFGLCRRAKAENHTFERFVRYVVKTYYTSEDQKNILDKYNTLKESESFASYSSSRHTLSNDYDNKKLICY